MIVDFSGPVVPSDGELPHCVRRPSVNPELRDCLITLPLAAGLPPSMPCRARGVRPWEMLS